MAPWGSDQTNPEAAPSAGPPTPSLSQEDLDKARIAQGTSHRKAVQGLGLDPGLDEPVVKESFGGN